MSAFKVKDMFFKLSKKASMQTPSLNSSILNRTVTIGSNLPVKPAVKSRVYQSLNSQEQSKGTTGSGNAAGSAKLHKNLQQIINKTMIVS